MTLFYPTHDIVPNGGEGYLWIYLIPKKVTYIKPSTKEGILTTIQSETIDEEMAFLAPMEFMESTVHDWQPSENIGSKLLETFSSAARTVSLDTNAYKVDTPLIYRNSERRKFECLIHLSVYKDPYKDVLEPVNKLRKYSSPSFNEDSSLNTKVEIPTVFGIKTKMGTTETPLVNIKNAALLSVSPTFRGPFINGNPSYCELTLSFEDMEPLSKRSFEGEPIITVTGGGKQYKTTRLYGGYTIPGDLF